MRPVLPVMRALMTGLALVLVAFTSGAQAGAPPASPARPASAAFSLAPEGLKDFAELVMSSTATRTQLELAAQSALDEIRTLPDEVSGLVYEAQLIYLNAFSELGFVRDGDGDQERAEELILRAIETAERANSIRETSEGFRVVADCRNQLLKLRGTAYRMTNFRAARQSADTAVQLDRRNPFAQLSAAGYYISAHPIAGGDTRRGLEHAEAAARRIEELSGEVARYVRFLTGIWVAQGLAAEGEREGAASALGRSREVYPENWWLAEVALELNLTL